MKLKLWMSVALTLVCVYVYFGCSKKEKPVTQSSSQATQVVIETKFGNMKVELLPNLAPKTVENFQKLASSNFYDGTSFHRVIPDFMIQGGDPLSKESDRGRHGTGGPGYSIPAEFSQEKHTRGVLSMARGGDPNSAGSQFFIVVKDSPWLDGQYTIFGRVTEGMEVADKIVASPRDKRDNPLEKIEMKVLLN